MLVVVSVESRYTLTNCMKAGIHSYTIGHHTISVCIHTAAKPKILYQLCQITVVTMCYTVTHTHVGVVLCISVPNQHQPWMGAMGY